MESDALFKISLRAFITNSANQLLLLQSGDSKQPAWDMPGSLVRSNRDILDILADKIEQDAGIVRAEWHLHGVLDAFANAAKNSRHPELLVVYHVKLKDGTIVMSDEDTDYTWYDRVSAGKLLSDRYPLSFTEKIAVITE